MATTAAIVLCVALVSAGCATAPPPSSPDPQLRGTWLLVLATDHGSTIRSGAEEITLTISDSSHTGGTSPCSFYSASIRGGLGAVFVDASILHRAARCSDPSLLHIDDQYIAALGATTIASMDDGLLLLNSPHSSLVFIKPMATSNGTLQNSTWSLVVPPYLREATAVRLTFGPPDELTLTTTCSESVAKYALIEDVIILHGVRTTKTGHRDCSAADLAAKDVLAGQLTADVSAATRAGPASLILTNRATEQPTLWLAS